MSKEIKLAKTRAEQLSEGLASAQTSLESVKHALPDYTSQSEAMKKFRGRSLASKKLFSQYRELFANDATVVTKAFKELEKIDIDVAGAILAH